MAEEITQRPDSAQLQMGEMVQDLGVQQQAQMAMDVAANVICPHCGALNESGVVYCASCGAALQTTSCPNCGSEIDLDADFCEVCHHYVRNDVCSFCGANLSPQDGFCPECGSPRGGIVCPTCHTLNDFAFCKQCGTPLTSEARMILTQIKQLPEYQEMVALAREYDELNMQLPYKTERDIEREDASLKLRERVLRLLAQDEGVAQPDIPKPEKRRMTPEQLEEKMKEKLEKLSMLLSNMAIPPQPSPAKVRNYAMAHKPSGVRLAWVCNWKNAMHSSPCGCAKPQLGGKWIVLGHGGKQEIRDDK